MKNIKMYSVSQVWWYKPAIPAFRRQRQEDQEFEVNVDTYIKTLFYNLHLFLKCFVFLIIFYVFSSTKSKNKRMKEGSAQKWVWGKGNVYTCK
jgi:hypothetical protein